MKELLVTLGPGCMSASLIKQCEALGVTTFRINLSHTKLDAVESTIKQVIEWTEVPICIDSEGAQLRNQHMIREDTLFVEGDRVTVHFESVVGDSHNISFSPPGSAQQFLAGDEITVDFDDVRFRIEEVHDDHGLAVVTRGGHVGSNKASDVSRAIDLQPITEKDREAIQIARSQGVSHFALSFTNRAVDVEQMRTLCGPDARIICKIESQAGVSNAESILAVADAILIDRGDLSRQIPIHRIPFIQRQVVSMARKHGRPVFVATNLLESMVTRNSPTRAEVNDVVSTLLMGADGLVLAAETAVGRYPVEAVAMIRALIDETAGWIEDPAHADISGSRGQA